MLRWIMCFSRAIVSVEADTADQAIIAAIRTLCILGIDPFGSAGVVRCSVCIIFVIKDMRADVRVRK